MNKKFTKKEFESYLWGAAILVRGLIDAGDLKQYIFPLLFLKRLSDVWKYDFELNFKETNNIELSQQIANERFSIPKGCHWSDIRNKSTNIGRSIIETFRSIENANSERMTGIFGSAEWTNKEQIPDETLKDIIEHFSKHSLDLENVPEDELGQGYEYLIKRFADDSGHTAQEFYTNRTLVHLMTKILAPKERESIYDPTCGTGGMLISAVAESKRNGNDSRTLRLYGQEIINSTASIAKMNLIIQGIEDYKIVNGNTLSNPSFTENDSLQKFDIVLANPPYSIKKWNRDAWISDPWQRNFLGIPPQGRADYAFLQHIIKSMSTKSGRSAILFSHGILERQDEYEMRSNLIKKDLVEAVIGLGPNLFYNSPMESCIIICRSVKPENRKNKVLFIDAVNEIKHNSGDSFLEEKHQLKIYESFKNYKDITGFSKVVTSDEIVNNSYNLKINLYVINRSINYAVRNTQDSIQQYYDSSEGLWNEIDFFITQDY